MGHSQKPRPLHIPSFRQGLMSGRHGWSPGGLLVVLAGRRVVVRGPVVIRLNRVVVRVGAGVTVVRPCV